MKLKLQITKTIPKDIEEGILYVSFTYWTTAHKCGCGCGQKVVLRLSPKHWAITLNGESVSMYPSVGNWQLPCRSHYWIEEGRILQAGQWSDVEIKQNRAITKGRRTPLQTPLSRISGGDIGEVGDGTKDISPRWWKWWNMTTNTIHRIWRKVIDRFGASSDS